MKTIYTTSTLYRPTRQVISDEVLARAAIAKQIISDLRAEHADKGFRPVISFDFADGNVFDYEVMVYITSDPEGSDKVNTDIGKDIRGGWRSVIGWNDVFDMPDVWFARDFAQRLFNRTGDDDVRIEDIVDPEHRKQLVAAAITELNAELELDYDTLTDDEKARELFGPDVTGHRRGELRYLAQFREASWGVLEETRQFEELADMRDNWVSPFMEGYRNPADDEAREQAFFVRFDSILGSPGVVLVHQNEEPIDQLADESYRDEPPAGSPERE